MNAPDDHKLKTRVQDLWFEDPFISVWDRYPLGRWLC